MNKVGLIVPSLLLLVGLYVLISAVTAEGQVLLLAGMFQMEPKFGILLGGIGVFGGVMIAVEMLSSKSRRMKQDRHES